MPMTITTPYAPGDNVMIIDLNIPGRVDTVIARAGGVVEYDVYYWWNGVRNGATLKEGDIRVR